MHRFSISDIERFSGIRSFTIRRWEERYGLVEPKRLAGNQRLYDLNDLNKLLRIGLLAEQGIRISALAKAVSKPIKR